MDNPGRVVNGSAQEQQAYNETALMQLKELWTNYGDLFEIWFDGGCLPVEEGGPDVIPLLHALQPDAVVFQGPPGTKSLLRWVGNEDGEAPEDCWSTTGSQGDAYNGTENFYIPGSPSGGIWAPAESDTPIRDWKKAYCNGWFWKEGEDHLVHPPEYLLDRYYKTAGRNSNLLLGMVIDNRGLVPDEDFRSFRDFGNLCRERFSSPLCTAGGRGYSLTLDLRDASAVRDIVIMEDIAQGQRILSYAVEGLTADGWLTLYTGKSIGHKRIIPVGEKTKFSKLRLICDSAKDTPIIRQFCAY